MNGLVIDNNLDNENIESTSSNYQGDHFGQSCSSGLTMTSELIATAVHDLKNPLAVIRGLGDLARLTSDEVKLHEYFKRVIKQVDELNDMIIDLLSIFRPQELVAKRIVPLLQEVLNMFEPECTSKQIKISLVDNGDGQVNICEILFKRSIVNIITNAVQLMDDGGLIEIKTEVEDNHIIIIVNDTAGGIPEEIRDSLFTAFTSNKKGGTGLGLFMVYHTITNIHKGKVWFETQSDIGTTFFIKLPLVKEIKLSTVEEHLLIW